MSGGAIVDVKQAALLSGQDPRYWTPGLSIDKQIAQLEQVAAAETDPATKKRWEDRIRQLRMTQYTGKASYGMTEGTDEAYFDEEFLCKTKSQCLRDYGKEDIENEIRRRLTQDEMYNPDGTETTFYKKLQMSKFTKKKLVDYLMKQNKRILQRLSLTERDEAGQARFKQAFPSKVTQSTMYDSKGMLKEQFLTEDHEDLTFYDDIDNKTYRVIVNPITRKATWEQVSETKYGAFIKGIRYKKDKMGRPDIRQLNYAEHHGKVVKDNKGKVWQVHCVKKNPKEPWEHTDNCKKDANGKIRLEYGPYDPDMKKGAKVTQGEFATPFGRFSYDELMKLPLDKILQMLIILELLDREDDYKKKMDVLRARGIILPGEEKYYEQYYPAEFAGRAAPGEAQMRTRYRKVRSEVKGAEEELQETSFRQSGLPRCKGARNERCYNEAGSYYPGICVRPAPKGKQSKCFKKNQKWIDSYNQSRYAEALGQSTDDWENLTLKEAEEALRRKKAIKRPMLAESRREAQDALARAEAYIATNPSALLLQLQALTNATTQGEYNRLMDAAAENIMQNTKPIPGPAEYQYVKAAIQAQLMKDYPSQVAVRTGKAPGSMAGSISCPLHKNQKACTLSGCLWNSTTSTCA